jgi:hypothetical protein
MSRAGLAILAAAVLLLAGCGAPVSTGQYIPWYASLIQRSVDFSEWLPVEYRNQAVAVQRIDGRDRTTADGSRRSWHVMVQDRSPEASLVLVLDQDLKPAWHGSSALAGTRSASWFVDADGNLVIGGLTISPPAAGGDWSIRAVPGILAAGGGVPWLSVGTSGGAPGRNYPISLCVDSAGAIGPAGALYLGHHQSSPDSWTMESADAAWTALPGRPALRLRADFLSANRTLLFPAGSVAAGYGGVYPAVDVVCRRAVPMPGKGRIELFCQAVPVGLPDQASPLFVVTLPWKALEDIDPAIDAIGLAILADGPRPTGAAAFADSVPTFAVAPDGSWLRSLPAYASGGGSWLPLLHDKADGSLGRRLDIRLPAYSTTGDGSLPVRGSSIGQQPYLLDGTAWWLAVDGFTRRLYICAPWWD